MLHRLHFYVFSILLLWSMAAAALDREAFTFTRYDLKVSIDPATGALSGSGTVELRNDSASAQNNVTLQVSSSLQWRSISLGKEAVPFLSQPYTSDIDHTGALTEAIVTLPQAVPPKSSVTLNVAYDGTIARNATRLTRIGTPEQIALRSDWDQISADFTAVRGPGNAVWFPVAIPAVSLAEGDSTFDALAAWRERHELSRFTVALSFRQPPAPAPRLSAHMNSRGTGACEGGPEFSCTSASYTGFRELPSFAVGAFEQLERPAVNITFLPEHSSFAKDLAASVERIEPTITEWLGAQREKLQIIELADQDAAPYESGPFLFTAIRRVDPRILDVSSAHQLAHTQFASPRPWISEGLAHLMQILVLEQQAGRRAAVASLSRYYPQLAEAEAAASAPVSPGTPEVKGEPLTTTNDPFFFRSKALSVWYMLRDMLGDDVLRAAIQAYRPEQDRQPGYIQSLLEKSAPPGGPPRTLEWFFDDWVYRDRGLPEFRIESAYPRKLLNGTYIVTVTVENRGRAGAEVPVSVSAAEGERSARVIVPAGSKAVVRIPIPAMPTKATVNDGSVPESNVTNNTFDIPQMPAR
jgi:hypothetical protein